MRYTFSYMFLHVLTCFLSLFAATTEANPYTLLSCDGCSTSEVRSLVYGQISPRTFSNYYVIDFELEKLYFYRLHTDQERRLREITPLPISSGVTASVNEYFSAMDSARRLDTTFLSNAIADALGIQQGNANSIPAALSHSENFHESVMSNSSSNDTCPNSQRLYDFVTTSSIRSQAYVNALNQEGAIQAINNTWNNFISITRVQITTGVVQANLATLDTTVVIDGAGSLDIRIRPGTETMDVVDGTVVDCHGNVIPTNADDIPGNYIFPNISEAERFGAYTRYLGVVELKSTYSACVNTYYQTRCKPSSKDGEQYVCTMVIPQCFQ